MTNTTRAFDMSTARQGQTLKYVDSGKVYIVDSASPKVAIIKNTHGGTAYVGSDFISPDGFEEIVFPPFMI